MTTTQVYTIQDVQRDCWRLSDEELLIVNRLDRSIYASIMECNAADPALDRFKTRIAGVGAEIERRRRLAERFAYDPLGPTFTDAHDARYDQLLARADELRQRFPIDRFLQEMFFAELQRTSRGRWKTRCVLPGHADHEPSMTVYAEDRAWCFVCDAGGDIFDLTQSCCGLNTFREAVNHLSDIAGMVPVGLFPPNVSYKGAGNRERSYGNQKSSYRPFRYAGGQVQS
jgi:hypothetical protein